MDRFASFNRKASCNHTRTAYLLKGDIRKFFANIDHQILLDILAKTINDPSTMWLLNEIVSSFSYVNKARVGLPLGNLTSQLLVNVYMNEFDQFIKRDLKVKCYIRYADDFVLVHKNRNFLLSVIPQLESFLSSKLKPHLHPDKVFVRSFYSGVDFLGWIHFPHHRILRKTTKRRMLQKLQESTSQQTLASYSGLLSHGNTHKISQRIEKQLLEPDFDNKK